MAGDWQKQKDFHRLLWHTNPDLYGLRAPTSMSYDPIILLGMGMVVNTIELAIITQMFPKHLVLCNVCV